MVKKEFPPNIEAIRLVFPISGSEIFAWGSDIYNPSGKYIPEWLLAHEAVHCKQQGEYISDWWARYLIDSEWRLTQELEAHQVEYRSFCKHNKDRNARIRYLDGIAGRLSSPLYGSIIKKSEAISLIRKNSS